MAYENAKLQFSENFNQSVMAADKLQRRKMLLRKLFRVQNPIINTKITGWEKMYKQQRKLLPSGKTQRIYGESEEDETPEPTDCFNLSVFNTLVVPRADSLYFILH